MMSTLGMVGAHGTWAWLPQGFGEQQGHACPTGPEQTQGAPATWKAVPLKGPWRGVSRVRVLSV